MFRLRALVGVSNRKEATGVFECMCESVCACVGASVTPRVHVYTASHNVSLRD